MKHEKDERRDERKKKLPDIRITELWMAKKGRNGWDTTFWGTITREKDDEGKEVSVSCRIDMNGDGFLWSRDMNQDACGDNLDALVELRLDYGLHSNQGVTTRTGELDYFLN